MVALPAPAAVWNWDRVFSVANDIATAAATTTHRVKEGAEAKRFGEFCAALGQGLHVSQASPQVIIWFLAYRASHSTGGTQVHAIDCPAPAAGCSCPVMMKYTTLEKVLGSVRRFLGSEWNMGDTYASEALGGASGNPAASAEVRRWLDAYIRRQKDAGVAIQQAQPVFSMDTAKFAMQCDFEANVAAAAYAKSAADSDLRLWFQLRQMHAFALTDGATGQRAGDLAKTLARRVVAFPDRAGLLFNWTAGKTYRDGHMYGVPRADISQTETCAVRAIERYVEFCSSQLEWDMTAGRLFPDVAPVGPLRAARLDAPMPIAAASAWLSQLMMRAGVDRHLTMSGYRSGTAIRHVLEGDNLMQAMEKSYWKTPSTALHYLKMFEVLGHSNVRTKAVNAGISEQQYQNVMNQPLMCVPAFSN